MKASTRYIFVTLICFNFALYVAVTVLEAGYYNTPYATKDSSGNPLGFNDPITPELYGIMFRNADWNGFCKRIGWYGGFYVLMQFVGLVGVLNSKELGVVKAKRRFYYFLVQLILFPLGWLGLLFMPGIFLGADGETISDGIPLGWVFQPFWFTICIALAFCYSKTAARSGSEVKPLPIHA